MDADRHDPEREPGDGGAREPAGPDAAPPPGQVPADTGADQDTTGPTEAAPRKPGLIRKSAVIVLLVLFLGTALGVWWFKDDLARDGLVRAAAL
ncbi:MAG: hypothetical protein ACOCXJ_05250, partial [Planctomycetota bacterium]